MERPVICWFKRDLRVCDHPALARAAALGPVIALYIIEPEAWAQPDASGRHYAFLQECLEGLRDELAKIGLPLTLRVGDAVGTLEDLRRTHGIRHLISHEETGNGWSFERDRRVGAWAKAQGVAWRELAQCGVVRRLKGRDHWQATWNAFIAVPLVAPVQACRAVEGVASDAPPKAAELGVNDACPMRQSGGRARALRALDSFLTTRGRSYRRAMSSPLEGARACSRLSPHLALGTMSIREVVAATKASPARDAQWAGAIRSFQARLAWRDHFIQKLEDEPMIEHRCLHPAYEGLRPLIPDAARLAAWDRGETGLPFVDACMRALNATGWLNFRMRAMLMAVASYHLWLDWRSTGPILARRFTDYEPGIHWPQVQMQSGTTGINTIRIYNPVKQGLDQDPSGTFTRRWLPELAEVPDAHLQTPWTWEGAARLLGHSYPAPVVDPVAAARHAREVVWGLRRAHKSDAETARIVTRHASRKRPRKAKTADPQLRFDF
ncbi:Cryptochrome-like protein cry2 [Roseovarius gaetbuli]|uniref:Cryptochrome-like protein cry2 n=1 Tax=Roseovarius gaetbuli TaxID=1356575 RepID=A0A1X6YYD6_9RHOB|nr:FAD-binding domain-containing protein [Roseovarius gaetbuli]SLN34946.1 Cryptochrome-like protein cry2 [Roseovarius gaetbuli]